jgi:hypothetical protein
MQSKIDSTRDKVAAFLSEKNIPFEIDAINLEHESQQKSFTGYRVLMQSLSSVIAWNFNSRKVEFLALNENLIHHLVSEGMTDEQIMEQGKVWIHIKNLTTYKKLLALSFEPAN